MKLKNLANWSDIQALEPLLFFAQRVDELLFDYTLDTYKAPALNAPFLCQEALALIDDIENGNIDAQNLVHVLEELEWSIKNDRIARRLIAIDTKPLFLGEDAKNQLHKQRVLLEIIHKSIAPDVYLFATQEELLEAIKTNKKSSINQLARAWITTLTNWGITKRHLYQTTEHFFFGARAIVSLEDAKEYFLKCMPTRHSFDVYFLASKEILKFQKTLEAFDVTPLEQIPAELQQIAQQHELIPTESETVIKVSNISSYDIYSGLREAEERIEKVRDLILLYSHKRPITWSVASIVQQCCLDHPVVASRPKSAVQNIADLRPSLAAPRLQYLIENVSITDGDDADRFDRIVDLHGLCALQEAPETQLLNLWICVETLIPSEPSRNKINNIIQTAMPPLMLIYTRRLIRYLLRDMIEWNKRITTQLLSQVNHDSEDWAHKLLILLSPEYEHLRIKLYEKLNEFPLLRHRIYSLSEVFCSKQNLQNLLSDHKTKVEWQIRRIYRTRNLIVHSGRTPSYLSTLIENLHDYLDSMINEILELSCSPRRISTFKQAFELYRLQHLQYEKALRDMAEISMHNITNAYFPRSTRKTASDLLESHTDLLTGNRRAPSNNS